MKNLNYYIEKVSNKEDLQKNEAWEAFKLILDGEASDIQISAFLISLKTKGETIEEITGAAEVIRSKSHQIKAPQNAIDTCGTGGDAKGGLNISTTVAFVVAACGLPVAKHGNRAVSSKSGSADILEKLGINIQQNPKKIEQTLKDCGMCFMMAPNFHSAMKHVVPVRKELKMRTIFNIIGPLANPANTKYQLLGVYKKELVEPIAHVLKNLGLERAAVVHGSDGMDELTTTGISYVSELEDGKISNFEFDPSTFGFDIAKAEYLAGGDAEYNAYELKKLFSNQGSQAYKDIVVFNSAVALDIGGIASSTEDAIKLAKDAIESGKAMEVLNKLVEYSNK